MAASMTEMVEAHLLNVRRELETLTQMVIGLEIYAFLVNLHYLE